MIPSGEFPQHEITQELKNINDNNYYSYKKCFRKHFNIFGLFQDALQYVRSRTNENFMLSNIIQGPLARQICKFSKINSFTTNLQGSNSIDFKMK